jgi:hypothetical protein
MMSKELLICSLQLERKLLLVYALIACIETCGLTIVNPDPQMAPMTLAKLQDPLKKTMDLAQKDLLPIYKGLGRYSKALDKVRRAPPPTPPTTC